jgi:ribonuclease-3
MLSAFGHMFRQLFRNKEERHFVSQLSNVIGYTPKRLKLYRIALSHRSLHEGSHENNERLEFLGDAVLGAVIAHYLFRRYPYKDEGFLTEMRSKMVNRQQLNDIGLKMGLKKLMLYNRHDLNLRVSHIFGNTLEALIGAIYLEKGYRFTLQWVEKKMVIPYLFTDELEVIDINIKNRLYGWASKNGKTVEFITKEEKMERGRRLFTIASLVDGELVAEAKAFNKKDASMRAAELAVERLGL